MYRSLLSSVKHSRDISDAGNEVNSSSSDNHGRFTSKGLGSSSVDLFGGDVVDLSGVLLQSEVSEGLEVSSHFFKTVSRVFKTHQDVHLQEVLGSVELSIRDRLSKSVKFLNSYLQEFSRVRSRSFNVNSEKTGISEVRVDGRGSVNESMLLHEVGDGTAVHALTGAT